MSESPTPTADQPNGKTRHSRWFRFLVITGSVFAFLAVLAFGGIALLYSRLGQIRIIPIDTDATPADTEPLNILLMGSDTRTGAGNKKYGLDGDRSGQRSDTTILLHVSGDRSRALAVSLPRDLWVRQPKCAARDGQWGYYEKFNNAFDAGGPACTTELVKQITGLPVHHIAVVDFAGFKEVVDALGGVEVCLNRPINDTASRLNLPAGKSVITGEQALAFVRARKTLGDGSDIGRIQRQQAFLSSAIRKVTDTGMLLNPAKVYSVLDTATRALTVDQSLDEVAEMRELIDSVRNLRPSNVTFTTMPFIYRDDLANVDPDRVRAQQLWTAMRTDTQWPPPPDEGPDGEQLTVAPENISVNIVDNTGTGSKAERVARQLRAAGFMVNSISDSGQSRATTVVRYPNGELAAAARTVAFAAGADMERDADTWAVTLEIGKDFDRITTSSITVAPPKSDFDTGAQPTTANEKVCAG